MRIISSVHGFPNWTWKPGPIAVQVGILIEKKNYKFLLILAHN